MQNCKRFCRTLLQPNPKLPQVINKSRIFNSYVAIIEIAVICFWLVIPIRTNQTKHVFYFCLDSFVNICGVMYVHVNYRIKYFQQAVVVSIASVGWIIVLMVKTFQMFVAT